MPNLVLLNAPGPQGPPGRPGINGPPGPAGPPGGGNITATLDTASSSVSVGYGVVFKNGKAFLGTPTHTADVLTLGGIALQPAFAGGDNFVVCCAGPVDPTLFNLGAGVACAVGLDATGKPVRVADAARVSGLKYVGSCDVNGAIYVQPRTEHEFRVDDFGALSDGVTDCHAAVTSACAAAAAVGGGVVRFQPGAYYSSETIGPLGNGVQLRGTWGNISGTPSATLLKFDFASGDGIRICSQTSTNSQVNNTVSGFVIDLSNAANITGAAVGMMGGGIAVVENVAATGKWNYAIVLDGAEEVRIHSCQAWNQGNYGIWLTDGNSRGEGWTVSQATNVITVIEFECNGPSVANIWDQGGVNHKFLMCSGNIAESGYFARISGPVNVSFDTCYSEEVTPASAHYLFDATVGYADTIRIANAQCTSGQAGSTAAAIRCTGPVNNLSLTNNAFATPNGVIGSGEIGGVHVSTGNHFTGAGRMYDAKTSTDFALVANMEEGSGGFRKCAGTLSRPTADWEHGLAIDSTTSGRPAERTSYNGVSYRERWFDSGQKWRDLARVVSNNTSNAFAGYDRVIEWGSTTASGTATIDVAALTLDQGSAALVTLTVNAQDQVSPSKTGSWIIRQRIYRPVSGDVTLLGSPTTVYSDADVEFTAPTIAVDTTSETVRAHCVAIAGAPISWHAKLELDRTCL